MDTVTGVVYDCFATQASLQLAPGFLKPLPQLNTGGGGTTILAAAIGTVAATAIAGPAHAIALVTVRRLIPSFEPCVFSLMNVPQRMPAQSAAPP
ncbi:hypothetical protein GCM10022383_06480 [Microbacterium soli]|uniref:Uncharacterized protein n=1 Tax=Microbacterium soli TaxID=446075 RepID=A0ABP7MV68_9MICO